MSNFFVDVIKKYPVTQEAAIKLVTDFLEYEHDSLCDDLELFEKNFAEAQMSFLLEDIEYNKKLIEAMDIIIEYYKGSDG